MKPVSLTSRRITLEGGGTALPYEWNGKIVPVADGSGNVLAMMQIMHDTHDDQDKFDSLIKRLLPDFVVAMDACGWNIEEFGRLFRGAMSDVCGIEFGGSESETKMWDEEEDAAAIRTSLRMAYGIEWDVVRETLPFAEFVSLLYGLPHETPLGRAMYYRNTANRPEEDEYNRRLVAEFDRLHNAFKLHQSSRNRIESSTHAMDDLALAMLNKAR